MNTMKRKFVINTTSGGGITPEKMKEIEDYFLEKTGIFDYSTTGNKTDATMITRHAIKEGYQQVIAIGGDGTINEVVNGFFEDGSFIGKNTILGISKNGTGSDFYKSLLIESTSKKNDWKEHVLGSKIINSDVGLFQFTDDMNTPPRFFINMAGAGISSHVVFIKTKLPKFIPSVFHYILSTILALTKLKTYPMIIQYGTKGQNIKRKINLLQLIISNGKFAGGGMKLAPPAKINNGYFQIYFFKKINLFKVLRYLPKLYSGDFSQLSFIEHVETKQLSVEVENSTMGVELDGEYIGDGNFLVKLIPSQIKLSCC